MSRWQADKRLKKVVLIRPPTNRWKLYRWYRPLGSREPPLGLLYIATYLKENGFDVTILDGEKLHRKNILAELKAISPEIVGVTSTTFSFFQAARLVKDSREILPSACLLMGGAHTSALPEDVLKRIPELDCCVFGEGEETLMEIASGRPADTIKGLVWRDDNEKIIHNPKRPLTENLDRYNLDWDLLTNFPVDYQPSWQSRMRKPAVSIMASRGCPFSCTFCSGASIHGQET